MAAVADVCCVSSIAQTAQLVAMITADLGDSLALSRHDI